jgi:hypothetical protein
MGGWIFRLSGFQIITRRSQNSEVRIQLESGKTGDAFSDCQVFKLSNKEAIEIESRVQGSVQKWQKCPCQI